MSRREALIAATGSFDDPLLAGLRSPAVDATALQQVLGDPEIGGFRTRTLLDQDARSMMRSIEEFFAHRGLNDLLLCYLSSHGVKDDDGKLYFAAKDTEKDWLAATAVSAQFLNERMDRCRARSIVVILDCCYSGAFVAGAKGDQGLHLKEQLEGHGRAVLTASNAIEYAWEGNDVRGEGLPSVFTAAIIEGLRTGAADRDGDGQVSVEDLGKHVYEQVRASGARQTPQRWTFGVAGDVYLARVPPVGRDEASPASSDVDGLLAGLRSVDVPERLAAVEQLAALPEAVWRDLASRLASPVADDREAAAAAVAELPDRCAPPLAQWLTTAELAAARTACLALAERGPQAVPALVSLLDRTSGSLRLEVVAALLRVGTLAAVFHLAQRGLLADEYSGAEPAGAPPGT